MGTPLTTKVRLKIKKIARDLTEPPADREWRAMWSTIEQVEGWLTPSEARWLYDRARGLPTKANIVEIGSYKGRSTCCLGLGCRKSRKRVFAVDTFDGGPDLPNVNSLPNFLENIEHCKLTGYIEPVVGLSSRVASNWDKPIDLLFIDGSHSYEDVLADFCSFFPYVTPGGLVAFHDVSESWPGVLKAWNEITKNLTQIGHCETIGYGQKPGPGDGPSPTVR
jgi:predicted O-methyltransferase YrrM